MLAVGKFAPATAWRAFFVCLALAGSAFGAAPKGGSSAPPDLAQFGKPDPAEAQRILEQFQQSGIPGQYFLEFELHALPRRGATKVYRGFLWGGRNEHGAITRVELVDGAGKVHRLLVQNGERSAVWRLAGETVEQVPAGELFAPVIPGVVITAFDLLRPFLYWPDATLERIARVRGRPAHAYKFRAPADFAGGGSGVVAARAYLDTQFNALMQTELLGASERVLKTMSLVDLKKIVDPRTRQEQWIPKAFDVRNEQTRDKTRFVVKAAGLNLDFVPAVFEPAGLTEAIQPPAAGRIVRLDR